VYRSGNIATRVMDMGDTRTTSYGFDQGAQGIPGGSGADFESPTSHFMNFNLPDSDNTTSNTNTNTQMNTNQNSTNNSNLNFNTNMSGNVSNVAVDGNSNPNLLRGLNSNILGYGGLQNFQNLDDMLAYNPNNILPNEGSQLLSNLNINITSPSTQSPLDKKELHDMDQIIPQDVLADVNGALGGSNFDPIGNQQKIAAMINYDNDNSTNNNNLNRNGSVSGSNSNYPSPMNILSHAGSQNYTMNNLESVSSNNDPVPMGNTESFQGLQGFQGSQDITGSSLRNLSSSFKPETFSPQSLGFSTNFMNNKLGTSISNTLGKSYGSHLGTSLNNLVSPSSTYDGFGDSPYGSYNDDSFKSPMNSPSFKSIASPSSAHVNSKSALSKESKLSRRRELHNAVERRRRDLIKEKIKELGSLIPPAMMYEPPSSDLTGSIVSSKTRTATKEVKANKNVILAKTVEYIRFLQSVLEAQDRRLEELRGGIENLDMNNNSSSGFNAYGFEDGSGNDAVNENENENVVEVRNQSESSGIPNGSQYDSFSNYQSPNNEGFLKANTDPLGNITSSNKSNGEINEDGSEIDVEPMPEKSQHLQDPEEIEKLQNSLSAFMEDVNLKTSNSKLKFMDFSNVQSEPLDFHKLSESLKSTNDNVDSFLRLDADRGFNGNDDGNLKENQEHNYTSLADEFSQTVGRSSPLAEPSLKFANDADFLDQLLTREPETNEF
jgi:hypothetical protein